MVKSFQCEKRRACKHCLKGQYHCQNEKGWEAQKSCEGSLQQRFLTLTLILTRWNRALRNTNKISSIPHALNYGIRTLSVSERTSKKSLSKIGGGTENSADRIWKTLLQDYHQKIQQFNKHHLKRHIWSLQRRKAHTLQIPRRIRHLLDRKFRFFFAQNTCFGY